MPFVRHYHNGNIRHLPNKIVKSILFLVLLSSSAVFSLVAYDEVFGMAVTAPDAIATTSPLPKAPFLQPIFEKVYAQSGSNLMTVDITKPLYKSSEAIIVSGRVTTILEGTPILFTLKNTNGDLITVAQIAPAEDGSFVYVIAPNQPWQTQGSYTLDVTYGSNDFATLSFAIADTSPTSGSIEVRRPSSQSTFDLPYVIKGGTIDSVSVSREMLSLVILINSQSSGSLSLTIPREILDAKDGGCDGTTDGSYIVQIDNTQIPFLLESSTATHHQISLSFLEGDRRIAIIGTCVVPEFGTVALVATLAAVMTVAVVLSSRNRHALFPN